MKQKVVIQKTRLVLLKTKTWRYLRYLHFRDAVARVASEVETVCICGSGHGYAELAVAAEFPHITFTLTDIMNTKWGYPNYHRTMDMAWKWGVDNMRFSVWNVLEKSSRRFDLVASTEMLEHIKEDELAAENMREAATKYIYCLVPFADDATNANPQKRQHVWEKFEHFVFGYDEKRLAELFPNPVFTHGTYWENAGQPFRRELTELTADETQVRQQELELQAMAGLVAKAPHALPEAQGIKTLARIG